jgi:hypothetical protein
MRIKTTFTIQHTFNYLAMYVIVGVFFIMSPSLMALLPVVQEMRPKHTKKPHQKLYVLFKPLAQLDLY